MDPNSSLSENDKEILISAGKNFDKIDSLFENESTRSKYTKAALQGLSYLKNKYLSGKSSKNPSKLVDELLNLEGFDSFEDCDIFEGIQQIVVTNVLLDDLSGEDEN